MPILNSNTDKKCNLGTKLEIMPITVMAMKS